ncbi:nitrilase-related carbon-nitrogen hydrolase [Stieleria marina]
MPLTPCFKSVRRSFAEHEINVDFIDLPPQIKPSLDEIAQPEGDEFRVLLWPCAGVPFCHRGLASEDLPGNEYCLDEIDCEEELQANLSLAIAECRRLRASVLVLPELSMTPAAEKMFAETLRSNQGDERWPILTVAGLTHRRANPDCDDADGKPFYLNESVMFGPRGEELMRHRKLTRFATGHEIRIFERDFPNGVAERILRRDSTQPARLQTMETPIGVLSQVICLDLLENDVHDAVARSAAATIFVPSLSNKTTTHANRARELMTSTGASVFVSNRALEPTWSTVDECWQVDLEAEIKNLRGLIGVPEADGLLVLEPHLLGRGASFFLVPRYRLNQVYRLVPCGRRDAKDRKLLFTPDPSG